MSIISHTSGDTTRTFRVEFEGALQRKKPIVRKRSHSALAAAVICAAPIALSASGAVVATSATVAPATVAHVAAETTSTLALLGSGAKCRVRNSTAAPSGWTGTYYDSSSWPWGTLPAGHQESVSTDFGIPARTAYLRCPFSVSSNAKVTAATLTARVDDGAVFYLNGTELARTNMPAGADTFETSASTVDPYDGKRWQTWQISPTQLKAYNLSLIHI